MKSKRSILIHIAKTFLLVGLMISACGPRGNVLVIWHTESDPSTKEAFENVATLFTKMYPGNRIQYQYIGWSDLATKIRFAISGDNISSLPDITHIQPYMAHALYKDGLLEDISDVVVKIEKRNGSSILPAVRDLQYFNGRHYGIAQHVGVSFILYRKDILDELEMATPTTWDSFLSVCEKLEKGDYKNPIAFPGNSDFFSEAIMSEYLNSNNAYIVNENDLPDLANSRFLEVVNLISRFKPYIRPGTMSMGYLDQFPLMTQIKNPAVFVMFAGARAFKYFEREDPSNASPNKYAVLEPPIFSENLTSHTSVDCEAFVVFKKNKNEKLAKEWLKLFYERNTYLAFCKTVPIQLMPIFPSMREEYEQSTPQISTWQPWFDQAWRLVEEERVQPYFMLKAEKKNYDLLFEMHTSRILYEIITTALNEGKVSMDYIKSANSQLDLFLREVNQ